MNPTLSALIPLAKSLCCALFLTQANAAEVTKVSSAECARASSLSHVQSRIVEKAAQGIVPLKHFIWRTRMIYQLDLTESVAWFDQRRALLEACEQRSARTDPGIAVRQCGEVAGAVTGDAPMPIVAFWIIRE
jgi:hypothetical protein